MTDRRVGIQGLNMKDELTWAIQRIEQSRQIHLDWIAHLQAHQSGGAPCDRCPPDIGHSVGDVEHHRSVAADYDRVLAVLRAGLTTDEERDSFWIAAISEELPAVRRRIVAKVERIGELASRCR